MKGIVRGVCLVLLCGFAYKGTTVLCNVWKQACKVQQTNLIIDERLSAEVHASLEAIVSQDPIFKTCPSSAHIEILKTTFPCLAQGSARLLPQGILQLELLAVNPVCVVNHDHVLTLQGAIVESHAFVQKVIDLLPAVELPVELLSQKDMVLQCKKCIDRMPWQVLSSYQCSWDSPTKTVLFHNDEPHFSIICNNETIPTQDVLHKCENLMHDLCCNNVNGQKKKKADKHWVVDVRFDKQIVVYSQSKGG